MTPASSGNPRVLLLRLREAMAEPGSPQERLDNLTHIIAANMVAEVCSIYIVRPDGALELYSTQGLKPEAVHETRLRFGEGLVGDIAEGARPLNLSDASSHPKFVYRPETGEEIFRSFLGVPVLRASRVIGVLAVQNRTHRHFEDEEVEALETVAMVLAEMLVTGAPSDALAARESTQRLKGMALSPGVAVGTVFLHAPRVAVEKLVADDVDRERRRMTLAIAELRGSVDGMLSSADMAVGSEHREILEAYRMFADDKGWLRRLEEALETGLTAEAAAEKVQLENQVRMRRVTDPYLQERLHDFDDLSNRLLRHLVGRAGAAELPENAILVARNMGAAELLDYERERLAGVVLEEGSPTAHVAIVARALEVPMIGRIDGVLGQLEHGDPIVMDGETGEVVLRPDAHVLNAYSQSVAAAARKEVQYAALRDEPPVTLDGERIALYLNAGLLMDLHHLDDTAADGIGLFRTELQFLVSSTLPRLKAQSELYAKVLDSAGDRPVLFRTLDIGSDKVVPYLRNASEANPALGWRALRLTLDRPALLRYQMRALLLAAGGRQLSFMFPMVTDVEEFIMARAQLDKELDRMSRLGQTPPAGIKLGAMLEVPALVWQLPALMAHVDFVSIGSNDLVQFFYACDRTNSRLAGRYDILAPPLLSFLRRAVEICDGHDVPVSLCGEMAGRPLEAMVLIGLGIRRLSMSPASIGPVKMMVRSLNAGDMADFAEDLCDLPERSVRERLQVFATDHGVAI